MRFEACAAFPLLWLALGLSTFSVADDGGESPNAGFVIEQAVLRAADVRYVVDARIDFGFSADNVEAMRNGVGLTVIVDIEVRGKRRRWWHQVLAVRELRYRIETSALTDRYRIRDMNRGVTLNFRSFEEMVDALGYVESIRSSHATVCRLMVLPPHGFGHAWTSKRCRRRFGPSPI